MFCLVGRWIGLVECNGWEVCGGLVKMGRIVGDYLFVCWWSGRVFVLVDGYCVVGWGKLCLGVGGIVVFVGVDD